MKKTLTVSILLLSIVLFASGSAVAQVAVAATAASMETDQSGDKYKELIEKMNKEMAEAMISGNQEKNMSFYAKDVISLPNYEKMLEGIDALRKSNEEMKNAGWSVKSFEPVTLKVSVCDKMITEVGTFKISFAMEGMEHPIEDIGKYVTIWERQNDGSLKIKIEMWNSDTNPMDKKM
jgi:ketosteroid isomerase-like protein